MMKEQNGNGDTYPTKLLGHMMLIEARLRSVHRRDLAFDVLSSIPPLTFSDPSLHCIYILCLRPLYLISCFLQNGSHVSQNRALPSE
jgi:hypothetical protein